MKEVSCRVFEIFLRELKLRGVSSATVCVGTRVDPATLADKNARIDWSDFRLVMAHLGKIFTRDELVAIGREHSTSPLLVPIALVGRLLFNTEELYEYWNRPDGPGKQLFACIDSRMQVLDPRHLVVDMMVQAGYEPCEEFYYTSIGGISSFPHILGLPLAEVTMTRTAFGARYHITLPPGGGRLASLRRAITWPFTVRRAGRELREANAGLVRQYREIAASQTALSMHTRQLGVAHRISEALHRDLDFERTLENIVASLAELAGFSAVVLDCHVADPSGSTAHRSTSGEPPAGAADVVVEVTAGLAPEPTRLQLWVPAGVPRAEYEELVEFLRPTITIAIENALAMNALHVSRQQLDRRVKELTHAYVLAEQASLVKTQFVTNMSHELRTPMNGVLGMTSLLRDTALTDEQSGYLEALEQSGTKLLRIIDDVLDFSQLEAGTLKLESADFDLASVVEDVVRRAAPSAWEKGVEVVLQVDRDLPAWLRGDPTRVSQLVSNLVSNGVKFTAAGGVVVALSLVERRSNRCVVRVEVSDTGIGIDTAKLTTLFQPFVQADGSLTRRFGGTGLGLSIARQIAEMMGAVVRVESTVGAGSRFWCDVPLEEISRAPGGLPEVYEGLRVALFDANPTSRQTCEAALRATGMTVEVIDDVGALAARAEQGWGSVDAVVLSEGRDSAAAVARVLAAASLPNAKAVLVRAPGPDRDVRWVNGPVVLAKPLRTDRLIEAVVGVRQRAQRPAAPSNRPPGVARAFVRDPEVLTERLCVQLLRKRGVTAEAASSIAELARMGAAEPDALIFTSLNATTSDDQRELEQLLHRLDLEPGPRRVVAMVSDRTEVPQGHAQRFLAVLSKPIRMATLDEVLVVTERSPRRSA